MKSRFSLWGPTQINGVSRWGVNEQRDYGVYTVGPHNGFETRRQAIALMRERRNEERNQIKEIRFLAGRSA